MRFSRTPRRGPDPDGGVLPLINVVFLLLIFFMIAGRLTAGDPFRVDPARSTIETSAPDTPLLLLAADGRLALDGIETDRTQLLAALSVAPPEVLRLKADASADSLSVVALLATLRAAGVAEVRLLTEGAP